MDAVLRLITLQDFNTRVVLGGATALGIACGVVGVLAMLRRRALMGDAIAHAALPGVCIAFLLAGGRFLPALLLGALAFGLLAIAAVTLVRRSTRVKEDAAIALTLSVFFGLGIALLTNIQRRTGSDHAGLDGFIFGKAAGMVTQDLLLLAAVSAVVLIVIACFMKEFAALCFDSAFAASIGRNVTLLDILLMGLVCLATVAALPAVGAVLVVALLTIPPAAARFWTDRLRTMLITAGVIGGAAGALGAGVSSLVPKLSAGPVITLAATAIFLISMTLAPRHGLIPRALRRHRVRSRIALQNLLRALWEVEESGSTTDPAHLTLKRAWTPAQLRRLTARAQREGLVSAENAHLSLTPSGRAAAEQVVRAHRLWEFFLIDSANAAPDHVDRDADQIEHVLPPAIVAELEARLRAAGRLPGSPHTIDPAPRQEVHG